MERSETKTHTTSVIFCILPTYSSMFVIRRTPLALVISPSSGSVVTSVEVGSLLTDHHAVHCLTQAPKPDRKKTHVSYRKYAAIDTTKFRSEQSHLITSPCNDIDDLSEEYDTSLKELLDRHAPLITRPITVRPNTPWHTIELLHAKRKLTQKRSGSGD